tara:strand:+ start:359 stop:1615 length:1257 start_codon:yes stop_codon:yes gene_type:complete
MINQNIINNFYSTLIIFLPISIILGPSISLISIIIICLFFILIDMKIQNITLIIKNKPVLLLILLSFYLVLNTFVSLDPSNSATRNLGFVRFIIFFIAINYFFFKNNYKLSIFKPWLIIFSVFVFDVYFERFYGVNTLGFGALDSLHGPRIVSFFKDEPIAGAYLNGMVYIVFGYICYILKRKNILFKNKSLIALIIFFIAILLTGERSNTIRALFGLSIFVFFLDYFKLKSKLIFLISIIMLITIIISQSDYLKNRYVGQLYKNVVTEEKRDIFFDNNVYINLYKSGINVFKKNSIFGVGTKNYRIATCDGNKSYNEDYYCSTHPHQIYIEFLSEHGILGSIICFLVLFCLIFINLKNIIYSKNYIQIGAFVYILTNFIPFIPSGSFFSDFNITFFMINLSIMYAVSDKTNIFEIKK